MPVPLEDAAQRFDRAYRLLSNAPPDDVAAPGGSARVVDRHSCVYGERRFGHVIMEYRGKVVSLLMTASDPSSGGEAADALPHVIGRSRNGLSVVSVRGSRHAILLVGDLPSGELTELAKVVSLPLAQQLAGRLGSAEGNTLAALIAPQPFATAFGPVFVAPSER
jgi:hypothetical protein